VDGVFFRKLYPSKTTVDVKEGTSGINLIDGVSFDFAWA